MKLTVKQNTVFKQYAIDSNKLGPADKVDVVMGQSFEVHSWKPAGKFHWKVAIVDQAIGNPARNTWYVFSPHVQLLNSKGQAPIPRLIPNLS